MHCTESIFDAGPWNILFAGVHVCTFEPGSFTCWGSEGVNQRLNYVRQVQQQRPESPTVTLTMRACKYKVHKLHQRYILHVCGLHPGTVGKNPELVFMPFLFIFLVSF